MILLDLMFNKWFTLASILFLILTIILMSSFHNNKLPKLRKIFYYISSFLLIYTSIGIIIFFYKIFFTYDIVK